MNFNVVGTPGNDTPLTDEERLIEFTRTLAEANHGPNLLHRNITEIRSVHSDSEDSGDEMEPTVSFSVELPESDTSLSDKEEEMIRALTEGNLGPNPHLQSTSEIHSVHSDNEDPVDELERLREVDHHILTRSPRCFVCLVGTKHVSQQSCSEVQTIIRHIKPQAVFLELCFDRMSVLTPQTVKVPTMREIINWWWNGKAHIVGIPFWWYLLKAGEKIELSPGSEFRVAYEEAKQCGAKVILGDRPVNLTLRRTWAKMPLWHKAKFLFYFLCGALISTSTKDITDMMVETENNEFKGTLFNPEDLMKEIPTLMETLGHERDQYMTIQLLEALREHERIVAIVGKGHMEGIKRLWDQPTDLLNYSEAEDKSISSAKILLSCGVATAGIAIVSLLYLGKRN